MLYALNLKAFVSQHTPLAPIRLWITANHQILVKHVTLENNEKKTIESKTGINKTRNIVPEIQ